jgi:predicted dehydrogenase
MSTLPVGIIGCGNISGIYAEAGRKFANLSLAACADLDLSRAEALAEKHGIARALTVEALIEDASIAAVINLTVPAAHAEVTKAAIERGKHVYSEKPLALRRRDARDLIGLAREKKVRIGCAPDTFLGAGLQTCRRLLDDGAIGVPLGGAGFMLSRGPESWHPNPEFFYKRGAGPLFDMGPYYLTALTTLLGPVRSVTGSARITFQERIITSQPHAGTTMKVETPTHVAGVLEFESGPVVTLTTSFDVVASRCRNIEIYGSEGTLLVPDPNTFGGPVLLRRHGESEWTNVPLHAGYAENSRGLGVADLVAGVVADREHRANERTAYHVLDIMHSLLDTAESGRRITLNSTMTRPVPLSPGWEATTA